MRSAAGSRPASVHIRRRQAVGPPLWLPREPDPADGDSPANRWHDVQGALIDTAEGRYAVAEQVLLAAIRDPGIPDSMRGFGHRHLARLRIRRNDIDAVRSMVELVWLSRAGPVQDRVETAALVAECSWVFHRDAGRATLHALEVHGEASDRLAPWDVGLLAWWLWLDGRIDAIPDLAYEAIRWLGDGGWHDPGQPEWTHRAPDGGPLAPRRRDVEQRDRRAAVPVPANGGEPRLPIPPAPDDVTPGSG